MADLAARGMALKATKVRIGNTVVGFGDSITIGNADVLNNSFGDTSWFQQFVVRSKGRVRYLYNAGISGNTTTQMLARIDSDVIKYSPKICFVLGGTNDVGNSISHTVTKSNLETIVNKLLSSGITPILCTIPPRNDATKLGVARVNAVIQNLATKYGLTLLDFFTVLADPANSNFKSGLNGGDGIHPNAAGAKLMSALAETTLLPLLPYNFIPLSTSNVNAASISSNGLVLVDTDTDGLGDNWTMQGAATATASIVSGDTAIIGNWQQMVVTVSGTRILDNSTTTGFTGGNRIAVSGRVQAVAEAGSMVYDVKVTFWGGASDGTNAKILANWTKDVDGAFYAELVVPIGCTTISLQGICNSGTGTLKLAQVSIVNLTTLG
jgi:lysophospholipase L1-like esterase